MADVRMISGCKDSQTSIELYNVSEFCLPDPAGKPGGACTAALLKVLYDNCTAQDDDLTFVQVLEEMRDILADRELEQTPQLSGSRKIDLETPFAIVPEGSEDATKRALMIGINYVGQDNELRGCHNDTLKMRDYLMDVCGFPEENITCYFDDGEHEPPTRDNILDAFKTLVEESEPGDVLFVHYAGHGGSVPDDNGDEEDGMDEVLFPVDFMESGLIRDDDVYDCLVKPLPSGVTMFCLMDCCHSGSVLDLPYTFYAEQDCSSYEMVENEKFQSDKFFGLVMSLMNE